MTRTTPITDARELDARSGDGIAVRLLWYPTTNAVTVAVVDTARDRSFELPVEPARALDAFHHPFALAAQRALAQAPRRAQEEEPRAA